MCLYKKCEVCGNKINKLQSIWNIYTLKIGEVIQCKYCFTCYKTNKIIEFLSSIYINTGIGIALWFIIGVCIAMLLPMIINGDIKFIIAFLLSFLFLGAINFIIAFSIPLCKTPYSKKRSTQKTTHFLGNNWNISYNFNNFFKIFTIKMKL